MGDVNKAEGAADGGSKKLDANDVPADDPHKTEKLTKAGRDGLDPDDGSE